MELIKLKIQKFQVQAFQLLWVSRQKVIIRQQEGLVVGQRNGLQEYIIHGVTALSHSRDVLSPADCKRVLHPTIGEQIKYLKYRTSRMDVFTLSFTPKGDH